MIKYPLIKHGIPFKLGDISIQQRHLSIGRDHICLDHSAVYDGAIFYVYSRKLRDITVRDEE